jgi:hypothetical protein
VRQLDEAVIADEPPAWTLNAMLRAMRQRAAHEHRMFRVIVLGGLALGAASSSMPACGGVVQTNASGGSGGATDAATDHGFPFEGGGGSGGFPMEGAVVPDGFPSEATGGAGGTTDGFPFEGGGGSTMVDATPDVGCFPMEADMFQECGAPQPDAGAHDAAPEGFPHETAAP